MSMSGTEDSDPDWNATVNKREKSYNKQEPDSSLKSSHPVRKFCDKWIQLFDPWLSRYAKNPNVPFCRACQCRLDCNKCHLQRHERTTKHARNLKIYIEKGEEGALENYKLRKERSKYYHKKKEANSMLAAIKSDFLKEEENTGYTEEEFDEEEAFDFVQADGSPPSDQFDEEFDSKEKVHARDSVYKTNAAIVPQRKNLGCAKKDRTELFMQIQKDKNDLMNTFKELMGVGNDSQASPPKEKNHVDLFFDSVSSSVKALTPKLIAEAKMRVSQLICELELRALTEDDQSNSNGNAVAPGTIIVSPGSGNSYVLHRTVQQNATDQQHLETQDFEAIP